MTAHKDKTLWCAPDLLAHEFPAPRWAIPGLIPEGLTLLAGPPKVGKSWLSLNLAVAVASGSKALGKIDVDRGRVLYLALEDTARRLQQRLETVGAASYNLDTLAFATAWAPMPDGGQDALHSTLAHKPDTRLVIVDVLTKVRGRAEHHSSLYEADYAAMNHLKTIADTHGVAVCVIHHIRKAASDDFLDTISGTNGLAGAADTICVLRRSRSSADAVLHVTGRDVEENTHALSFESATGTWTLLDGDASQWEMGDTRATILAYLTNHPGSGPRAIAQGTSLGEPNVKNTCRRMLHDGQLAADNKSRYSLPDTKT